MTFSTVPFVFSPNTQIQSAQVNADFASVVASGNNIDAAQITTGILPVVRGGTGANTVGGAATAIGAVQKAGDTMTGSLFVPYLRSSGNIDVVGTLQAAQLTSTASINGANIAASGSVTAGGTVQAAQVTSTGGINGVNVTASGTVQGSQVTSTGNVTASGTVQGSQVSSTGNIASAFNISAGANIAASGTITGAYINSTGNLDCAGNIDTPGTAYLGAVVIPNQASYYARDTGGTPQSLLAMGNTNWCLLSAGAATVTTNAQFAQNNHLYCLTNGAFYCGLSANAWAGVVSFSFPAPSDQRLKTDIEALPDDCANLVSAVAPKRFRWREGVNALDPARTHWGFIAQEIGEAFTSSGLDFGGHTVGDDAERTETLDTNELVAVLWKAVTELTARVKDLEASAHVAS